MRPVTASSAVRQANELLAAAAARGRIVDRTLAAATVGLWVAATWVIYAMVMAPSELSLAHQIAFTCFGAGFVGYLLFLGARGPTSWLLRRFAPDWVVVDDEDGVVKVVGSVGMADWDYATAKMLTIRPGLIQVWNATEMYGVALAARPFASSAASLSA